MAELNDPALIAIKDAWDVDTGAGRDPVQARLLSDQYIANNQGYYANDYAGVDLADLVQRLEVFRAAGMPNDEWRVQVWIWSNFEPQNIGGEYRPTLRNPGSDLPGNDAGATEDIASDGEPAGE